MDLPTLTISAGSGWLDQRDRFSNNIAGKEQENYTLLSKGELAYNKGNSKLAKYGVVFEMKIYEEALVPRVYHSFKATNESSAAFLEYMFATKILDNELAKLITSGARMDGLLNIGFEAFKNITTSLPSPAEQTAIGSFFRTLDDAITLCKRKLDGLKELKRGYLQLMFPQAGESVPQVRFAGFEGEWVDRKLGEVAIVKMCRRIFNEETTPTGDIPFYKIGTFGGDPDAYIARDKFEEYKNKYPYPEIGDVLISAAGTIGRTVVYSGNDEYFQDSNIVWLSIDKSMLTNNFLEQFYIIADWSGIEGTTIKRLYNANILDTTIFLPSTEEQAAIGAFFRNLDEQITAQQNKLEQLRRLKAAYLQKMFV